MVQEIYICEVCNFGYDKKELAKIHKIHFAKHPEPEKYKDDPATMFLAFKPTWWRYTEYKPEFFVLSSK